MSNELEAAADAATGALAAHAVDGGDGSGHGHSGPCLNCGTEVVGLYCHVCGQSTHTHRTLSGFGHDILHGVFHFEGRFWHTLPLLLFKPGQLTRRYIDGQRVRFISPVALFLFMVFVTFAVMSMAGGSGHGPVVNAKHDEAAYETAVAEKKALIASLETRRAELSGAGKPTADIDAELEEERSAVKIMDTARAFSGKSDVPVSIKTDIAAMDYVIKKYTDNPKLFLYKLQSSAYKFLWLLIPISMPFLWLMFAWRKVALYDHAVFATYSLSAMLLLLLLINVLGMVGVPERVLALAAVLIPPLHMYKQLRGTYGVGRFGAMWRVVFLLASAGISTLIFLLVLIQMLM